MPIVFLPMEYPDLRDGDSDQPSVECPGIGRVQQGQRELGLGFQRSHRIDQRPHRRRSL